MPQGSRYIKQAIRERWTAESLDDPFIALRGSTSSNPVLDSGEIAPGTPFPYCVMAQTAGSKVASMSGKTSHAAWSATARRACSGSLQPSQGLMTNN